MTTRDPFLDALVVKPGIQTYWGDAPTESAVRVEETRETARSIHRQANELQARFPVKPPPAAPQPPKPKPVESISVGALIVERISDPANPGPDVAEDIDRIVRELVAAGDIVWDGAAQTYRIRRYAGASS